MPWDLAIFHESAARNGLDGIAAETPQRPFVVTGDDIEARADGAIVMASCITAAIANFDEWRFHRTLDPNWVHSRTKYRDQTGAVDLHNQMFLNYPFRDGEVLNAQADNGNNAQVESVGLAMAYGGDPRLSVGFPRFDLPAGAKWINGVGGTTVTANALSEATITWSENFDKDRTYRVLGMTAYSATGYWARLLYRGRSPWVGFYPGVPAGDTAILNQPVYGDFGAFVGHQPPNVEMLCSGGDTAQYAELLIV